MAKYNSIDTIKAKVFFKILETKDYQLLSLNKFERALNWLFAFFGKKFVDVEKIFINIYDEFFIKSDNHEANEYLRLTKEIAFLEHKITYLKQTLHLYFYNRTTEKMRLDYIEALKIGYDIIIDAQKPFIDEVQRVLSVEVGIIQNDLSVAKASFEQMTKKSQQKAVSYESRIVGIENVLKRSVDDDDVTLAKYIELEKSAQNIVSEHQKNKKVA